MGAIHWSQTQSPKASNTNTSFSFEWAMKNFSSGFPAQGRKEFGKESLGKDREEQGDQPEAARCEWDFSLSTVVSSGASAAVSDALGVIEFDPSHTVVATGGIARKIRIYNFNSLLPQENIQAFRGEQSEIAFLDHGNACSYYICTPAKLSSLRWKPGSGGRLLGSGDYDGVVTEYDLERQLPVFERDEHGGRRVWSVDYSHWDPFIGASGSDDGTMQMWDPRCGGSEGGRCVAKVQPTAVRSSVCCVEFSPFGDALIAVGCADRKAYTYDARRMEHPLNVFEGHSKTVTYVRFLDTQTMVSAGTDGCLKLWNITDSRLIRTYKGHLNSRSFVGLSVWRHGGLLGCGSENNQVFVYDKRWGEPIWIRGLEPMARPESNHGFVNSVCWRQVHEDQCTLLAGGSNGVLQVFVGTRKS
ncbi:EARLY FLOWERING BY OVEREXPRESSION 2, REPRESSOR OF UV-B PHOTOMORPHOGENESIS 2 [Hibiscus trionum]|uniref:EARLY FLOWERING BY OVEREXPRESSION 2, REPRESSOR OF UV-B PHOTOMORPHOGENESIS 2 n=1 Tax=Hibiscus trionum TaxID=183268 RepID=A0A9W7HDE3_HIBTR|nr:EARLY FLOWERING BY OVEREXPRESSION 2, REPRESSOR OF UV-B PHOTOMORPHOGENESIS 2 [Hibiscus trionum]